MALRPIPEPDKQSAYKTSRVHIRREPRTIADALIILLVFIDHLLLYVRGFQCPE